MPPQQPADVLGVRVVDGDLDRGHSQNLRDPSTRVLVLWIGRQHAVTGDRRADRFAQVRG
jgi:hypothetical protein